jgi:hypothetical protein
MSGYNLNLDNDFGDRHTNVRFDPLKRTPTGDRADIGEKFDTKHTRSHRVIGYRGPDHFLTEREKDLARLKVEHGFRRPERSAETLRNTWENRREVFSPDMRIRANFGDRSQLYERSDQSGGGKRKSRGKRTKKGKKANKKSANKRKSAKKGRKSRKH